jgi:hypothetical protein
MKLSEITPSDIIDLLKNVDKKTWIKIGAGAAIFIVLWFLVIYPAWFKRVGIRSQVAAVKGQIGVTYNLMRKKPELVRIREESLKHNQSVKGRMYAAGESSLLLGVISKMAEQSKVSVVASQPAPFDGKFPAPFDQQYEANIYNFSVEGGYHQLGDFISRIESNPKLLRVRSFAVLPREDAPEVHQANISLSAVSAKSQPQAVAK